MKISPAEIVAASDAFLKNGYLSEALKAAYTVRKQRKAAKRERQRKEKDKQVVESVKPVFGKLDGDCFASAFDAAMKPKA